MFKPDRKIVSGVQRRLTRAFTREEYNEIKNEILDANHIVEERLRKTEVPAINVENPQRSEDEEEENEVKPSGICGPKSRTPHHKGVRAPSSIHPSPGERQSHHESNPFRHTDRESREQKVYR